MARTNSGFRQISLWCALGTAATGAALALGMESFAASSSATAGAIVIEPVAITTRSELVFSASGANMTRLVIVSAAGIGGSTSGAPSTAAEAGTTTLTISIDGDATYAVTVPSTMAVTHTAGTQIMTVAAAGTLSVLIDYN